MAFFQWFNWNRFFVRHWPTVLFSVLLGAFSHLVWDKLTHHTVPVVESVSGVKKITPSLNPDDMYFFFWDIASLVGALVLLVAFIRQPAKKNTEPNKSIAPYWLLYEAGVVAIFLLQLPPVHEDIMQETVIIFINAMLLSLLLVSAFFTKRPRSANALSQPEKKEGEQYQLPS